jgi:hypothetical protein
MPSLLQKFITDKITDYEEPQRAGTPRGERVGFSATKYHASLLALTDDVIDDQAQRLHISYGMLAKWRSEEDFKKLVLEHIEEFAHVFLANIFRTDEDLFSDVSNYSTALLRAVQDKAWPGIGAGKNEMKIFYRVRELLRSVGQKFADNDATLAGTKRIASRLDSEQRSQLADEYLGQVEAIVSKAAPTYEERRVALLALQVVRQLIKAPA